MGGRRPADRRYIQKVGEAGGSVEVPSVVVVCRCADAVRFGSGSDERRRVPMEYLQYYSVHQSSMEAGGRSRHSRTVEMV
ncbi:hypothetical protein D3C84_1073670 [compost metagenome]